MTELAPTIVSYNVLLIVALTWIVLALVPAVFSKSVRRMKTWCTLLGSFIVYCISFLLLVGHQGQQDGENEPSPALCVLQAGLVYAAPPITAAAGLLFVIELYIRMSAVIRGTVVNELVIYWMVWLLPIVHVITFGTTGMYGLNNKDAIVRHQSGMYCHVKKPFPALFTGAVAILFLALMLIAEVYTIVRLFSDRAVIRSIAQSRDFPLKLFIRTFSYTIVGGLSIVLSYALINTSPDTASIGHGIKLNMFAIIALSIALVFGSQMDIIRFYMFWRWFKPHQTTAASAPALPPLVPPISSVVVPISLSPPQDCFDLEKNNYHQTYVLDISNRV